MIGTNMRQLVTATYEKGVLRPDQTLDLEEGSRVVMSISSRQKGTRDFARMRSSAGAWRETIDCEKLIDDLYEDRLRNSRSEPLPELH